MTGVFAAIVDDFGRLCLVHQSYGARNWGLPGGGVEPGESPFQALQREVREEAGFLVQVQELVGVYAVPSVTDQLLLCFTARVVGDDAWQASDEITERQYFSRDDLPEQMNHVQRRCALDAFAGERGIVRALEPP